MSHEHVTYLKCPNGHHLCELCARMENSMRASEAEARARKYAAERCLVTALRLLGVDTPQIGKEWERLLDKFRRAQTKTEQAALVRQYAKKHKAKA